MKLNEKELSALLTAFTLYVASVEGLSPQDAMNRCARLLATVQTIANDPVGASKVIKEMVAGGGK